MLGWLTHFSEVQPTTMVRLPYQPTNRVGYHIDSNQLKPVSGGAMGWASKIQRLEVGGSHYQRGRFHWVILERVRFSGKKTWETLWIGRKQHGFPEGRFSHHPTASFRKLLEVDWTATSRGKQSILVPAGGHYLGDLRFASLINPYSFLGMIPSTIKDHCQPKPQPCTIINHRIPFVAGCYPLRFSVPIFLATNWPSFFCRLRTILSMLWHS